MRNLKKFLALVLAMMMTLSLMVTVNAAKPADFSDKDKITAVYKEAVDVLSALKVVKGDDGFRPGDNITRAEVAAIVYRIVTGDVEDKNVHLYEGTGYFTDVETGKWYDGYVNYCANNGLVQGVGGGKFEPSANVTGYQALVMILRAIGYNNPKEFSDSDWKLKASGYGRRLGITANIAEGSLGGYATREVIAEIMYRGLLTPTVTYTLLNDYQPNVAGKVNGADRYEDLLLRVFDTVHKSSNVKRDNYGNPSYQWLYWSKSGVSVEIPIDPVDTFYTAIDECELVEKLNSGDDIDVDYEFLNGRSVVRANTNTKGEIIGTRTLDALHTTDDFVGAQGRETKVYHYSTTAGTDFWDIVYVDTYLGVVKAKTPVTLDTNGHVMHKATLSVEVGAYDNSDNDHPYAMLTSNSNFDSYNVGDVVLLNTWSPSVLTASGTSVVVKDSNDSTKSIRIDWAGTNADQRLTVARLNTRASANPVKAKLFPATGTTGLKVTSWTTTAGESTAAAATESSYIVSGTFGGAEWKLEKESNGVYTLRSKQGGADYDTNYATTSHDFDTDKFAIVSKATDKTVTITGTTGAAEDKTGIYTADGTIMANVVYHMHNHAAAADTANAPANDSTPTSVADLYKKITNEEIGRTYKLYLDAKGNILGMTPTTAASVGVVVDVEAVKVSTGRYAVEATLFMEDESTLTARFLDDSTPGDLHKYFADDTAAIATVDKNALLEVSSYTKNGQTYYQVEDKDTDYTNPATSGTKVDGDGAGATSPNVVYTGVSDTLGDPATIDRVNGNTVFFIAYKDFQYNWGTGNTGDNESTTWKVIRDFRDIPTITGDGTTNKAVVQQTLEPNADGVAKYAAITCQSFSGSKYDMAGKTPVAVDDSYLIIAPIGTYARYSEYSVMHNGVKETLKVANLNTGVNTDVEIALASGQLIKVEGWNLENAAISVSFVPTSNVVKQAITVSYDDAGVLTIKDTAKQSAGVTVAGDGSHSATADAAVSGDHYMTLSKTVKVMIVNRDRNTVYDGTTANIAQYASYTGGHAFAWELDANGYISTLYILD